MRELRFVTLEEIKNNARIETNDEDQLIKRIGLSAEDTVLNLMERTVEDILEEFDFLPGLGRHENMLREDDASVSLLDGEFESSTC